MDVEVSKHGDLRVRKRIGINKNAVKRLAAIAYEKGKRFSETKGRLHQYLKTVDGYDFTGNEIIVYGNNLFIFRQKNLITAWPLPGILPVNHSIH